MGRKTSSTVLSWMLPMTVSGAKEEEAVGVEVGLAGKEGKE